MKLKRFILAAGISAATTVGVMAQKAPEPCGLVPSERQLEWYDREMIAFFHFGLNTFEEFVNEGDGKAPAALFNPTALDCTQWMQVLKSAGIPAAILTAKHADGFCLWPSRYTDYCVKNAAWKNGKGCSRTVSFLAPRILILLPMYVGWAMNVVRSVILVGLLPTLWLFAMRLPITRL